MTHDPRFVAIDNENCQNSHVLRNPAREVTFPISAENEKIAQEMLELMVTHGNCAGLAAPQIGYDVRIIIYHVDEIAFKYRVDVEAILPPTILINPIYKPLNDEKRADWEGCLSVNTVMGEVRRFTEIAYEGYDLEGRQISGIAKGFLARLLQHEIDHINGVLCLDHFEDDLRHGPIDEMRKIRMAEIEARTL